MKPSRVIPSNNRCREFITKNNTSKILHLDRFDPLQKKKKKEFEEARNFEKKISRKFSMVIASAGWLAGIEQEHFRIFIDLPRKG